MIQFEWDICIFRKLKGHSPWEGDPVDDLLLGCLQQANLDAFWSSVVAMVNGYQEKLVIGIWLSKWVGLEGPYFHEGPLMDYNHCGYKVAIQMLRYSKFPGKRLQSHLQINTIKKLHTSYSSQV
jgi:hypothetical protein